jgi:hypothetical protein
VVNVATQAIGSHQQVTQYYIESWALLKEVSSNQKDSAFYL